MGAGSAERACTSPSRAARALPPPTLTPQVIKLTAGHCPHDEVPEQVNAALLAFMEQRVLPHMAQRGSSGSGSGPTRLAAARP